MHASDLHIQSLPHSGVAHGVVLVEVDGELREVTTVGKLNLTLRKLLDEYATVPVSEHPAIYFYWNPEDMAVFFKTFKSATIH